IWWRNVLSHARASWGFGRLLLPHVGGDLIGRRRALLERLEDAFEPLLVEREPVGDERTMVGDDGPVAREQGPELHCPRLTEGRKVLDERAAANRPPRL